MTDDATPSTPGTRTERPWTSGPFPPLWLAVLGSIAALLQTGIGLGLCLVGSVVSLVVARRRPWVAAVAIVLVVWSAVLVAFTGRFLR